MSIFEERERAMEQAFINAEEARYRALALRNRMIGEWAAERLGLKGSEYEAYVDEIASSTTAAKMDEPLVAKIRTDLTSHGIANADAQVRAKMTELLTEATQRLSARKG